MAITELRRRPTENQNKNIVMMETVMQILKSQSA